jgi:hypothetical protein
MAFNNRLNKILLILVFLGILFILFKEKEGFANAFDTLDEVYSGALLKYFPLNSMPIIKKNERDFMSDTDANYVGDYSQKTNNPKYRKIPCEKNNYDYKICEALYKENNKPVGENKTCNPGFGCRRVGFFCSLLD